MDTYLTLDLNQTASIFGRHRDTILRWVKDGYFPHAYKDGPGLRAQWLIPDKDINMRLAERGRPPIQVGEPA